MPSIRPESYFRGRAFVRANAYKFGFSQGRRGLPNKEEADDVPVWARDHYRDGHRDGLAALRRFQAEAVA